MIQHILFWCLSFLVLVNILKVSAEVALIDVIYTGIFHVPILLVTYLNLSVFVKLFLEREKYFYYGISVIILVAAGALFYLYLFEEWIDLILEGYYFIAYYNFWDISLYLSVFLVLTTLVRLARSWFHLAEAEKEKSLVELKSLKSQINPHFLFNSLNSIYGLSRKKSDLTPEAVIRLSDVLRYVIYDAEATVLELQDELNFIQKYIQLQQLRSDENLKLDLHIKGDLDQLQIAPLIFLPFVENAFKYAHQSLNSEKYIELLWQINEKQLIFKCRNSSGNFLSDEDDKYKGVGIENVIKRLELLYPEKHKLEIVDQDDQFSVNLTIRL